jgi:uncharacterized cupredoxin-like copper-binding protein
MTRFGVMLVPAAGVCCVAACPAELVVVWPKAYALAATKTVSAHDQVKEILKSLLIFSSTFLV